VSVERGLFGRFASSVALLTVFSFKVFAESYAHKRSVLLQHDKPTHTIILLLAFPKYR